MLGQQGIIAHGFWRHGWPWIIVILAAVQIATAGSAQRLADGVVFGLIGVWLVLVVSHWHGLTYSNSWPLTRNTAVTGITRPSAVFQMIRARTYCCARSRPSALFT